MIRKQKSATGVKNKFWSLQHIVASAAISFSTNHVQKFLCRLLIRCIPSIHQSSIGSHLILLVVVLVMLVAKRVGNFSPTIVPFANLISIYRVLLKIGEAILIESSLSIAFYVFGNLICCVLTSYQYSLSFFSPPFLLGHWGNIQ